jgi:hypothetical protein
MKIAYARPYGADKFAHFDTEKFGALGSALLGRLEGLQFAPELRELLRVNTWS